MVRESEALSQNRGQSRFMSSTAMTVAGASVGAALAACAGIALAVPGVSLGAMGLQAFLVGAGALAVGAICAQGKFSNNTEELEQISLAVRGVTKDPNLLQRIPVSSGGVAGELSANLNVLIDGFASRQKSLQDTVSEVKAMRDRSESASLAKSQFLANMSHELRTPLNAIIGYAMLLQEDAQDAGQEETASDLSRVLRAARHLLTLINDILDLSKIEAGKDELEYSPVHLRTLMDETMAAIGPLANTDNVVFELNLPDEEVYMQTDMTKVRQCLVNLLSNAFKFTEEGSVTLDVDVRASDMGDVVVYNITDTGIGITPEQIEKLFEAFVQADTSTTQKYGGTGLGLAITRRLANLLGGNLTVESEYGEGSTFRLTVPREPIRKTRIVEGLDEVAAALPANDDVSGDRVALVIDDDASTVDLLSRWLKRQGYSVIAAYDGESGLEVARDRQPDLILLDIHMPKKNGWDVLARLREDENLSEVPVIVVSVDDNRKRGLDSGASEFLTKPATQEHLSRVLETYNTSAAGNVLVIDDDEDAGNIIERSARHVGLEVSRAFDGVMGLEMARKHHPSAIILDLTMPEKDGFSVLTELDADPELRRIPVIVVSARTLNGKEFHQLAESGCDFHAKGVSSPYEIAANLVAVVNG